MLNSATRVVLLLMTLAFIWLTVIWKIDWKDFMNAFLMVLSFYFGWKTSQINDSNSVNIPITSTIPVDNNTNNITN